MIEIIDCDQNSPEWYQARCGIPTASNFATIMAKGEGKVRRTYLLKLAGEILTGEPSEGYTNAHMERGHEMEPEARSQYAFLTGAELTQVGFVRNGAKGASPDSLIGNNGVGEFKTKLPHLLIEVLLKDQFPPEHRAQCQGALWVCEREWVDIACYWPKLPLFVKRAYRDDVYIKQIADEVDRFNADLADTVELVRRYGMLEAA
ncbi:YqaJ viral recombinase family protein [Phyllobacterium sp. BT25]|uniref:YqaJ viral recombinase family protein n=1 Tax=Phyllobacterium pellucidum TaxID=2740464 RepID=A0A849VNB0_9HYPH|nr:lambda exonuclease family protein [Phyllobacterium pellucidum]NTS31311.1 YqaJ viral recombinase family protein [Phyllobacterium pellucidum]